MPPKFKGYNPETGLYEFDPDPSEENLEAILSDYERRFPDFKRPHPKKEDSKR